MSELVSIVMPAYNNGEYVGATVRTVLAQTYRNWELLFVDDASTDRTAEIVASFHDPRIRIFRNEKNLGAALSRNRALREAKGKWIAFLDADDWWHPKKLERQLRFMQETGHSFTCTDHRRNAGGKWADAIQTGPLLLTKRKLYRYCYIYTGTVMYDRDQIGLVQIADLKKNNDYAMWLKIIEKADCHRLPECLSFYIKHGGSISSGNKIKLIRWHYALFNQGQGFGPVVSALLTLNNLVFGILKKTFCRRKVNEKDRRMTEETQAICENAQVLKTTICNK
ncbi:MAG: glycosyltransferase family 2 protein [Kiritimatiellae bacterium]|nr:glycosyltransferase family 2 protein [Kiritimatiellia bacterium]